MPRAAYASFYFIFYATMPPHDILPLSLSAFSPPIAMPGYLALFPEICLRLHFSSATHYIGAQARRNGERLSIRAHFILSLDAPTPMPRAIFTRCCRLILHAAARFVYAALSFRLPMARAMTIL